MARFLKTLHSGQKGFTLMELLIVVAILGILAAIVVPNFVGFINTGEVAAANTEVASVESAASAYLAENDGVFPADSDALETGGYLSKATVYATYLFDIFGRVTNPSEKAAADSITWNEAEHKWEKG